MIYRSTFVLLECLAYLLASNLALTLAKSQSHFSNQMLMASRSSSRAQSVPIDLAETFGVETYVNEPYRFSYKVEDNSANMQFRNEEKTPDGQIKGSYGYKDANGIYRMVEYYADATGFHVKIHSNEPGIINKYDHPYDTRQANNKIGLTRKNGVYNPANVEWAINGNAPLDLARLTNKNNNYNGDWRSTASTSNHLTNLNQVYALNGGESYDGAESHLIESSRLNSIEEKQKLSLLVVPRNGQVVQTSKNSNLKQDTFINQSNRAVLEQDASLLSKPLTHNYNNLNNGFPIQKRRFTTVRRVIQKHPEVSNLAYKPKFTVNSNVKFTSDTLNTSIQRVKPNIQQELSLGNLNYSNNINNSKNFNNFNNHSNLNLYSNVNLNKNLNTNSKNNLNLNLNLNEFSTKFPEKWHQIFSSKTLDANLYGDKPVQQYAQLSAAAARPDITVLADQSFMKPTSSFVSLKELDRTGSLTKTNLANSKNNKSARYEPPLADYLLASASVNNKYREYLNNRTNTHSSSTPQFSISNKISKASVKLNSTLKPKSSILNHLLQASHSNNSPSTTLKSIFLPLTTISSVSSSTNINFSSSSTSSPSSSSSTISNFTIISNSSPNISFDTSSNSSSNTSTYASSIVSPKSFFNSSSPILSPNSNNKVPLNLTNEMNFEETTISTLGRTSVSVVTSTSLDKKVNNHFNSNLTYTLKPLQ